MNRSKPIHDPFGRPSRPGHAVAPIERFDMPAALDGRRGSNRAPPGQCQIAASTDKQAIDAWLGLRHPDSHTWRAYRKESERLLLWAVLAQGQALSSMTTADCAAYREFLAQPGPQWTAPRNTARGSAAWRPFEGPLSARSAANAMAILRALFEWLTRRRYLAANPWHGIEARVDAPAPPRQRSLDASQWQRLQDWLDDPAMQPPSLATQRLRAIVTLAYCTGMRRTELAAARVSGLRRGACSDGQAPTWSIMVMDGSGGAREVALPQPAVQSLQQYFSMRGLDAGLLGNPPETPLLSVLAREAPLGAGRLYELVAAAFADCAAAADGSEAASRMGHATPQWLRHTHAFHAIERGVAQQVLRRNLGHRSPATAAVYCSADRNECQLSISRAFADTTDGGANDGLIARATDRATVGATVGAAAGRRTAADSLGDDPSVSPER